MIIYSQHFLLQIQLRNIAIKDAEDVLSNPEQVVYEEGLTVYQKRLTENNKLYLLRIFVNEAKQPRSWLQRIRLRKSINTYCHEGKIR